MTPSSTHDDHQPQSLQKPIRSQALAAVERFEQDLLAGITAVEIKQITPAYLPGHDFNKLAFSPDGRFLAGASGDAFYFWERESLRLFQVIKPVADFSALAITPDSQQVIGFNQDRQISFWDVNAGKCVRTIPRHIIKTYDRQIESVGRLSLNSDGTLLMSHLSEGYLTLWDLSSGAHWDKYLNANDAGFHPDGFGLATTGWKIKAFDLQTGESLFEHEANPRFLNQRQHMQISLDGRFVVTTSISEPYFRVLDLRSGQWRRIEVGVRNAGIGAFALSPDGQRLLGCTYRLSGDCAGEHALRLFDVESGSCLETLIGEWSAPVFSPDGRSFAAFNKDQRRIQIWEMTTGRCQSNVSADAAPIKAAAVSGDGHFLATNALHNALTIWDLETGLPKCHLSSSQRWPNTALSFSPDGRLLASVAWPGTPLRLWDMESGQCLREVKGFADWSISPDGQTLALSLNDHICLQDLTTGRVRHRLAALERHRSYLYFSPDGRWLYALSPKSLTLRRWATDDGRCALTAPIDADGFWAMNPVAFSQQAECFLAAQCDGRIVQYDLKDGRMRQTFTALSEGLPATHMKREGITALTWHPEGHWFAAANRNHRVCACALSGGEMRVFENGSETGGYWDPGRVCSLLFIDQGKILAQMAQDGLVRFWDFEQGHLLAEMANLDQGYLWTTPPDDAAPNGWLHTNRPDLLLLQAVSESGGVVENIPQEDVRFQDYLRMYNDGGMVMKRIHDRGRYEQLLRLRAGRQAALGAGQIQQSLRLLEEGSGGQAA